MYEGGFNNNMKEGLGQLTYKSGAVLEGQWRKDKVDGEAKLSLPNGDQYIG